MCDAVWYKEFLDLNPRERKRRDLIVDYAESQPLSAPLMFGQPKVADYLRLLIPRYWFDPDSIPPGTAGASLGLTPDQETHIIAEMAKVVIPAFQGSAEYTLPHGASSLTFPPR